MKLSQFIRHLEAVLEREGDIEVVNKDGQPLTLVHVEQRAQDTWFRARTYADPA